MLMPCRCGRLMREVVDMSAAAARPLEQGPITPCLRTARAGQHATAQQAAEVGDMPGAGPHCTPTASRACLPSAGRHGIC